MALSASLETLAQVRAHMARWCGYTAFSGADGFESFEQTAVDDEIAKGQDRVSRDLHHHWGIRPDQFSTFAPYTTGTVTVTKDSAAITGAGGANWSTGGIKKHDKFGLASSGPMYRIISVDSATTATLDTTYVAATASGATYTIVRDEYALAAGVLWVNELRETAPQENYIPLVPPGALQERIDADFRTGHPQVGAVVGGDSAETGATGTNQRLLLWPAPDSTQRAYAYEYRTMATLPTATFEARVVLDLIIHAALAMTFLRRGRREFAADHEKHYQRLLEGARRSPSGGAEEATVTMRPLWRSRRARDPRPNYIEPI